MAVCCLLPPCAGSAEERQEPAYLIDFSAAPPHIERVGRRSARVTGPVLKRADGQPSRYGYSISIDLTGGPIQGDIIPLPRLAGRGPTRFADNLEPTISTIGGLPSLSIRLLGTLGSSDESAEGLGLTYYRDPSSTAVVRLTLGDRIELSNVHFTLTDIDGAPEVADCEPAGPNRSPCGGYIDRVTMTSGRGGYLFDTSDAAHIHIDGERLWAQPAKAAAAGGASISQGAAAARDAGNVAVSHPGHLGNALVFEFDDPGAAPKRDDYHDFNAPHVGIGLASPIRFDLEELPPPPPPPPDPNLTQVTGILYKDLNGNGELDAAEPREAGRQVVLIPLTRGAGGKRLKAQTDASGQFRFDAVMAGEPVRVEARRPVPPVDGRRPINPLRYAKVIRPRRLPAANAVDFGQWPRRRNAIPNAALLLPDLTPLAHFQQSAEMDAAQLAEIQGSYPGMRRWYLDTKSQKDRVLLRFGTLALNRGEGPLHLVGGKTMERSRRVFQRIYTATGEFIEHPVNAFLLTDQRRRQFTRAMKKEEDRRLVNVELFERYNLWDPDSDRIVASGYKTSFCLTDVLSGTGPEQAWAAPIAIVPLGWTCGEDEQGINVGYSDYYGPALPNQWIDVTEVPSGSYWLEVVVNPANHLRESDYDNNRIRIKIDFTNPLIDGGDPR